MIMIFIFEEYPNTNACGKAAAVRFSVLRIAAVQRERIPSALQMIQKNGRNIVAGSLRTYRADIISYHRHSVYHTGLLVLADGVGPGLTHL